ncbi:site-specific DNA-methyltransferase [Capnocytophaga canimorsus]|uniref:site-specific DNA-methyltransferase n=1 Tax=Capnocytophaga canimorsus TaxID=28188 RepID=UPI0037D3A8EA
MNDKQTFIQQGFSVLDTENKENKLIHFLKEHYPQVLKDGELNLTELKTVLGLPIDEKVNGYGLNFVGRGVARAKYAQETEKELLLNRTLSKNADTTQNMVLKGDNLDSLKLLKPHYSGKIKCIYIDPPYNTSSDEFVYPDKFDREEAEVLGIADNLSEEDFDRMEFSFKTKKSHNGWLAFMYPRLLLARDLLAKDGVIFISIDDNEQANLKILCDEIFGEENVEIMVWNKEAEGKSGTLKQTKRFRKVHEYILAVYKNITLCEFSKIREALKGKENELQTANLAVNIEKENTAHKNYFTIKNPNGLEFTRQWKWSKEEIDNLIKQDLIYWGSDGNKQPRLIIPTDERRKTFLESILNYGSTTIGRLDLEQILEEGVFSYPKPMILIKKLLESSSASNDLILDFFAGSGTTGHAVMVLNAEDGGNRKFILCQIDEPIAEGKPAYQFCIDNGLPPVISSITIERLRRVSSLNPSEGGTSNKGKAPSLSERAGGEELGEDYGFKVFDHTDAPKLTQDENGQILLPTLHKDALSRIYTMIFKVGLDEPSQLPQEVLKDCIYKIGHHYYITNSEQISKDDFATAIKDATQHGGKIFIDGWTASLNATLQHYKEEVQIVF